MNITNRTSNKITHRLSNRKTNRTKTNKISNKTVNTNIIIIKQINNLLINNNFQEEMSVCPMIYVSLYVLQQILNYYTMYNLKKCYFLFFDNPNIANLHNKSGKKNIINSYNYEKYINKITKSLTNYCNTINIHVYNKYSALKYKKFIKKYNNSIDNNFLNKFKNINELVHVFFNNKNNNLTIIIFINTSGIECDDNTLLFLIYIFTTFLKNYM